MASDRYSTSREVAQFSPALAAFIANPPHGTPQAVLAALTTVQQTIGQHAPAMSICQAGRRECYDVWMGP